MVVASKRIPDTPPSGSLPPTESIQSGDAQRCPDVRQASVRMVGYSGTPLPRKLGIKPGHRVLALGAPGGFVGGTLGELPEGVAVRVRASGKADVIVSFHDRRADLARRMPR